MRNPNDWEDSDEQVAGFWLDALELDPSDDVVRAIAKMILERTDLAFQDGKLEVLRDVLPEVRSIGKTVRSLEAELTALEVEIENDFYSDERATESEVE